MQDLPRTFPCHPWLDTPEGKAALRRVLVAYSFRDSDVGYCQVLGITQFSQPTKMSDFQLLLAAEFCVMLQGLNYIAALLLLVMKTEEDAFWMLAVLLENVLVNDCYTDNLSGCHVEQRVFRDLLAKKCPRFDHLPSSPQLIFNCIALHFIYLLLKMKSVQDFCSFRSNGIRCVPRRH